jgi:hypothetical protein
MRRQNLIMVKLLQILIQKWLFGTRKQQCNIHDVVLRSEQLESGLTCMMCRKPKENDGHTCCEECAGLAF